MRAELMQEYRHCQTYPSRDHCRRFVQKAVWSCGDRETWGHTFSLCLSSASDTSAQPYWVGFTSLFCFLSPFSSPVSSVTCAPILLPPSLLAFLPYWHFPPQPFFPTSVSPALPFPLCISTLVFLFLLLCPLSVFTFSIPTWVNWC